METYFFPPLRWPVFFLFRCFVSLQIRARAQLFISSASLSYQESKRASWKWKKHQKCTKNSNDLKCFAGQVLCWREGRDGAVIRKFINEIFADFRSSKGKGEWRTRKTSIRQQFFVRTSFFFGAKGREEESKITTKPERTTSNEYYTILGCPFCSRDRIFPSRMMETCNVIQQRWKSNNEKKNAQFLVSRGDDLSEEKNEGKKYKKYIKFYCFLLRRTRTEGMGRRRRSSSQQKLFFARRERTRIDGARKRRTTKCKNQKLFLCTRKFISYHSRAVVLFVFFGQFKSFFDLHSTNYKMETRLVSGEFLLSHDASH